MDYAYVSWTALDVQELRPDWSTKKCEEFLEEISSKLEDHMVDAGWFFIGEALKERNEYPHYRVICNCGYQTVDAHKPIKRCFKCGREFYVQGTVTKEST